MEEFITISVLILSVIAAIFGSYLIYKKTGIKSLSLIPSGVLLLIGAGFTAALFIDAATTPGSWGDLAGFIIAMLTIGVVFISIIGTGVMFIMVNRKKK
jgi:hypothetical protein